MRLRSAGYLALSFLLAGSVLFGRSAAFGVEIQVPGDQPTIQAAIDVASVGDAIIVAPGTYVENLDLLGKAITLQSSGGSAVTTIDGSDLTLGSENGSVLRFGAGADATIEGFTITGGVGSVSIARHGGGAVVLGANPIFIDLHFTENVAGISSTPGGGAAVFVASGSATFIGCGFFDNLDLGDAYGGGAVFASGGTVVSFDGCTFTTNTSNGPGGAIAAVSGSQLSIERCRFEQNTSLENGGAVFFEHVVPVAFVGNQFLGNQCPGGLGGAVYLAADDLLFVSESNVYGGNQALVGSALYFTVDPDARFIHDTIAHNGPSAVRITSGSGTEFHNVLIWGNVESSVSGSHNPLYNRCCLDFPVVGDFFTADPRFTDPDGLDFSTHPCSPLVDAGTMAVPSIPIFAVDGAPRVLGSGPDVGAYEYDDAGSVDCNCNSIPDVCDIDSGFATDLDLDGIPDSCGQDCNANGIDDGCELGLGDATDCNFNGVLDECDIAAGALDTDVDGIPDECQIPLIVPTEYPTIQAAVDAALPGRTVLVLPGRYVEAVDLGNKEVVLRSAAGPKSTVLEPTGFNTPIVRISGGQSRATVVEGFTFRFATGPSGNEDLADGGSIRCAGSSPTIRGNVFADGNAIWGSFGHYRNSAALIENNEFMRGGLTGVRVLECDGLEIRANRFIDQRGGFGVIGISVWGVDSTFAVIDNSFVESVQQAPQVVLENCVATLDGNRFADLSTTENVSGMALRAVGGTTTVSNCDFSDMVADGGIGTGLYFEGAGSAVIEGCRFERYGSPQIGGGQAIALGDDEDFTLTVRDSVFLNSVVGNDGGAIQVDGDNAVVSIERCRFENNHVIDDGGAIYIKRALTLTLRECDFIRNSSDRGGAIRYLTTGETVIENCSFYRNRAGDFGGAVYGISAGVTLEGSTFYENVARRSGSAWSILMINETPGTIRNCVAWGNLSAGPTTTASDAVEVTYCAIQGGFPGLGNLDTDPLIVVGDGDRLLLSDSTAGQVSTSPCVDAGDPAAIIPIDTTTRTDQVADTGTIDMGRHYVIDDCDDDGVPDLDEPDTDGDGVPDDCDVCAGAPDGVDCDGDGIPDSCAIANGDVEDCNGNEVPDRCEFALGLVTDCNGNGLPDSCDIAGGTSADFDGDGVPDECTDCDGDGVSDLLQELADCDADGAIDACQIVADPGLDTNLDGRLDSCQTLIDVPGSSPTIQAAIDAANVGDVIVVQPGTYSGSIDFLGKNIEVRSVGGPEVTTIIGSNSVSTVTFANGETSAAVLAGFTVTGGTAQPVPTIGGGVLCDGAEPTIIENIIIGNAANNAGGVAALGAGWQPRIERNLIVDNAGFVPAVYCGPQNRAVIANNVIRDHTLLSHSLDGVVYLEDAQATVVHNTLVGNDGGTIEYNGSSHSQLETFHVANNIFWDNIGPSFFLQFPYHGIAQGTGDFSLYQLISADPLFVDPLAHDYRLTVCSPAIGLGSPRDTFDTRDRNGRSRLADGHPDAGAFEYADPIVDCNGNGRDDSCDLEQDCDGNGVPDECDLAAGVATDCDGNGVIDACEDDCNGNGVADICELQGGTIADCNFNEVPDSCDIANGTSADCNGDGVPDECELYLGTGLDCDGNFVPDACDIAAGTAADCDGDLVPDSCQIAADPLLDCDGDGALDSCQIAADPGLDCDVDGELDTCTIASGAPDCNLNGTLDSCDIAAGTSGDCNLDGIPDECNLDCDFDGVPDACEIASGSQVDCDGDGVPDDCDTFEDCDGNGIADSCDFASGAALDCNCNGIPDSCDIAAEPSLDVDLDGIPDDCGVDCDANGVADVCEINLGAEDCDGDGVLDDCQIAADPGLDSDGNGRLDGCERFIRGDANGDTALDLSDPIWIIDYLFLGGAMSCLEAADANADGRVNTADPIYLLGSVMGLGPLPPSPFPACGLAAGGVVVSCEETSCP